MDLADQIDEYICSFEGIGDLTMDSLAIFVFIWAVFSLFSVWLCKFLYNKYLKKDKKPDSNSNSRQTSVAPTIKNDKQRLSEPRDILSTKAAMKEVSAQGSRGREALGSSGSASSLRRRVVRQSSTGPETLKKRYVPPPSNVVGPESTSVTWTSQVFRWLYSDLVIVNELLMVWVSALNEQLRKSYEEHGVSVEIVRVLSDSPAPGLTNIFCNSDEHNPAEMIITFDCDAMPVMQVKAIREKSGRVETSHYKVTVSRFRTRMSTSINYNTIKGEMRVEGFPDIRITTNRVGAIKPMDQDEQQLQSLISEMLSNVLRETIYPMDFSMYSTCPRAEIEPVQPTVTYPINYDSLTQAMERKNSNLHSEQHMVSGKRLLVKIVKGEGLKGAKCPFVVVEMDEPAQKNQTISQKGVNPHWDEHFLFELSQQSAEILFEVYDREPNASLDSAKFLGLGLVGIDELAAGPASSQVLCLQPRPYEAQNVYGTITIDFVFIEGAEIPTGPKQAQLKEALRISSPLINEHIKNGSDLADAAVRALQEGALTSNGHPSKSTLIIHSVQRQQPTNNSFKYGEPNSTSSPNGIQNNKVYEHTNFQSFNNSKNHNSMPRNGNSAALNTENIVLEDRGRSKKRNFFGTLKKRLSKSKSRTHSADNDFTLNNNNDTTPTGTLVCDSRSLSVDRAVISKKNSLGPQMGIQSTINNSRRSSISESSAISGFSSASNKTFIHEASTLVLETLENGIKRHFIVPLAIAQRPRWRRKGIKLHIYNDHTFVAKHLSGSGLQCAVCAKSIPRRPGKQGYECRDCYLICHKQCHVRAPQACPNPTILSMELTKLNSYTADRSLRK